jgi:hypothetical protein
MSAGSEADWEQVASVDFPLPAFLPWEKPLAYSGKRYRLRPERLEKRPADFGYSPR